MGDGIDVLVGDGSLGVYVRADEGAKGGVLEDRTGIVPSMIEISPKLVN